MLKLSGSAIALAAAAIAPALAQTPPADNSIPTEQVVVTGTSIRGVAPVGSNLISVGPAEIAASGAQTISQILENVPALTGMGNAGQGPSSGSSYQPTIHQLGASASNSTLMLIDGHRIANSSTNHTTGDPGLIPVAALQRVEVLADGSSSIYGSDAVAGVVNFITRKRFDGAQISAQTSFLDGATDEAINAITGTQWDKGSVYFAYTYSYKGMVQDTDRPFTNPNHTAQAAAHGLTGTGSTNFNNFSCASASIQPSGSSVYYTPAAAGGSIATNSNTPPCSAWAYGSLAPTEVRNSGMVHGEQQFGDNLTVEGEIVYGNRRNKSATSRGTVSATVFGAGANLNPFFAQPAGYTGTATKQSVRWDADALLGPGALSLDGADSMYGDVNAEYRVPNTDFVIDLLSLVGRDDSFTNTTGLINTSVANLALNGTTNSSGNTASPSITGTNATITQALTAANALDIWNPAGSTNRTSAAALASLTDNANFNRQVQGVEQFRLSANGTAFSLPAGDVKVAFGGEFLGTQLYENTVQGANAGPSSQLSTQVQLNFHRRVYSAFAEVDVPVIGPDMHVPLVQKFAVDISGRYDDYSDFGVTANPKFSFDWQVVDDLKLRGNWSTSFVAPSLDVLGDQYGIYNNSRYQSTTQNVAIPVATYPEVTQFGLANCTATSVTCNISSLQGIRINTGDHNAQAQKGHGWSLGADFTPTFLPGLTAQATFWSQKFRGGVTGPTISAIAYNQSMNKFLTFYPAPGGATPAQIAALTFHIPQQGALPSPASYILDVVNSNYLNLDIQGIDASFRYEFDTDWGHMHVGDSLTQFVKFNQSYGNGATYDVLNTSGANNTFPSVATQMRADVGWALGSFDADLFWNDTGAYRNWASPVNAVTVNPTTQNPSGGGDHVNSNSTFDLHVGYQFNAGMLGDDEVSITVRNLLNKNPPYFNSSLGYDAFVANPLGRIVTLGLSAKL
jgi:iron complex outermembrane receptor protein